MARFANLDAAHRPPTRAEIFRWGVLDRLRGVRRKRGPGPPAPWMEAELSLYRPPAPERLLLTWIGHASFLGALEGVTFLVDPVLSSHAGWLYRRHGAPGVAAAELPRVDLLLVSHSHYDHLDEAAVRALPREVPVVVPRGLGRWFRRRRFARVVELGWWQQASIAGVEVTLVPARHWSRRRLFDTNRSWWGGFVLRRARLSVYHAGDSGWFDGFRLIGERFPGLEVALLPVGSYEPAWFMEPNHLNPEQAGRAFLELGARVLVPMHWGAFQLTDEPLREPAARLETWWRHRDPGDGRRLATMAVGETLVLAPRPEPGPERRRLSVAQSEGER